MEGKRADVYLGHEDAYLSIQPQDSDMFIRNRKSLKTVGVALCCSCFSLCVSSAAGPSLLTPPDGAHKSSIVATQQGVKLAQEGTATASNPQSESLVPQTKTSAAQLLDSEELAQLAVRAEEPGEDVVGGALDNQHLTYIVIALAAAVVVLIAK